MMVGKQLAILRVARKRLGKYIFKVKFKNGTSPVIPGSLDPLFNVECQVPQILKGSSDISREDSIKGSITEKVKDETNKYHYMSLA